MYWPYSENSIIPSFSNYKKIAQWQNCIPQLFFNDWINLYIDMLMQIRLTNWLFNKLNSLRKWKMEKNEWNNFPWLLILFVNHSYHTTSANAISCKSTGILVSIVYVLSFTDYYILGSHACTMLHWETAVQRNKFNTVLSRCFMVCIYTVWDPSDANIC